MEAFSAYAEARAWLVELAREHVLELLLLRRVLARVVEVKVGC